jgi:hypothetical protein
VALSSPICFIERELVILAVVLFVALACSLVLLESPVQLDMVMIFVLEFASHEGIMWIQMCFWWGMQ